MKVQIEVDITPEEARRFLGLPDMSPIHDVFTSQARSKIESLGSAVDIEPLMRTWGSMGGLAQDALGAFLGAAMRGGTSPTPAKPTKPTKPDGESGS